MKLPVAVLLLVLSPVLAHGIEAPDTLRIPAFTAFAEPDPDALQFSEQSGVTGWADSKTKVVWYGEVKTSGRLDLALSISLPEKAVSRLQLTVADQSLVATVRGEGLKPVTISFGSFQVAAAGFYSFSLTGLSKEGPTFGDVDALLLSGPARKDAHFSLIAERGAPSVHLTYPIPDASDVVWFYNEVTVKTDPIWSYYEACGFSRGYFGIQVNSAKERRIIFSVWDSGKEPTDRSKVAADDRVQLVAKGDGVEASDFGNEGTGGHSHLVYPWKTGDTYRFLVSATPQGSSTIYSGYFYFPERNRWELIASFRAPKDGGYLHHLYSFNEDFEGANGQQQRLAEFGNQWIKTAGGDWSELLKARFTHTKNGYSDRLDRGAGVVGNRFYLSNGGFIAGSLKYGDEITRPASGKHPGDIVLPPSAAAAKPPAHHFGIDGDHFALDGKPFQIISGEMHYLRVPREYWRERLKMARAMGLNTISTYVFWNMHELRPGVYDFSGDRDLAAFIRMAQEEGLYVILRPGPYACAEWDLGGYPAWLLSASDIVLRSSDEKFLEPAAQYLMRVGKEVGELQIGRGGPIIAVQVENEYGSFDKDKVYLRRVLDALRAAGFTDALLYTADGPEELFDGTLPDIQAVVNVGPGEAREGAAALQKFRPGAPIMFGEWWAGWFDHWGRPHHTTDGEQEAQELDWILEHGYSINLYMFHGGTSWGFMNGANNDKDGYWPDTSSYDYSAALDESGRPSTKYFLFRDVIARRTGQKIPDVPVTPDPIEIAQFSLQQVAPLFANLPKPVASAKPVNMESLGQSYGYILYRSEVTGPASGELAIADVRDYAQVYLNGKLAGTLDRRLDQDRVPLQLAQGTAQLDILVENTGRINFTKALREERKGITTSVAFGGKQVTGWQVFTLPMNDLSRLRFQRQQEAGPAFYRGTFDLAQTGDTFLDMRNWSKGTVWVNGHQLGRFWNIGPQGTLYLPGPWLKQNGNEIIVFDLKPQTKPALKGLRQPVLDDLRQPHPSLTKKNKLNQD
jgi:beta-galactosidase